MNTLSSFYSLYIMLNLLNSIYLKIEKEKINIDPIVGEHVVSQVTHIKEIQKIISGYLPKEWIKEKVSALTYSIDGKYLVSGHEDKTIKVWDAENYELLFNIDYKSKGHNSSVLALAFSPDGKYLVSAGLDYIKIWDANNFSLLETIKSGYWITSLTFSPDSKHLAITTTNNIIMILDAESHRVIKRLEADSNFAVAYSPHPHYKLFIAGATTEYLIKHDYTKYKGDSMYFIKIWEGEAYRQVYPSNFFKFGNILEHINRIVKSIAYSSDGEYLAISAGNIYIFGDSFYKLIKEIGEFEPYRDIHPMIFSPNNMYFIVGYGGSLDIRNTKSFELIKEINLKMEGEIKLLAFSPDSKHLAVANYNTIKILQFR